MGRIYGEKVKRLPVGYGWPGSVRELEKAFRRIFLTGAYVPRHDVDHNSGSEFGLIAESGMITAEDPLTGYCRLLYARHGTYQEVARITGLDRRKVRRQVGGARVG